MDNTTPQNQQVDPQNADQQPENQTPQAEAGDQSQSQDTSANSDLSALEQELQQTQQKLEEMTAMSQRALADLQNFKRRTEEEKGKFVEGANAILFMELLPTLDSASRALEHENKDAEWAKGVEQTLTQLLSVCEKMGLKTIPTDGPFDPTMHEALLTAAGPQDTILEVLEKGFMLGDKVLKPARVKVGDGQETAE